MYTSIKNARKAARKQGLEHGEYTVEKNEDGSYSIATLTTAGNTEDKDNGENVGAEGENEPSNDNGEQANEPSTETPSEPVTAPVEIAGVSLAPIVAPVAAPEVVEIVMPEGVDTDKPVAFVWAFLSANVKVPRKVQIKHMIDTLGLNPNMTKTQTSRWYKVGGDKTAYLAIEKAKRDAEKAKISALADEIRKAAEQAKLVEEARIAAEQAEGNGGEQIEGDKPEDQPQA